MGRGRRQWVTSHNQIAIKVQADLDTRQFLAHDVDHQDIRVRLGSSAIIMAP